MQCISGFSLFQMNPHLVIAELNILQINNSSQLKKILNDIQTGWPQFNTKHSLLYGKLGSQASFTLNGKCTLPSCGQNINNTEIFSRLLLSLHRPLIPNVLAYHIPAWCPMQFGILDLHDPCQQIRHSTWRNESILRKLWNTITRATWVLI